jgi:hypothetical protein
MAPVLRNDSDAGFCEEPAMTNVGTKPGIGETVSLPFGSVLDRVNVVVRQVAGGQVRVEAVNALAMMSLFPKADLSAIATEVNARLTRVVNAV